MKIKRKHLVAWIYVIAAGWFLAIAHARGEMQNYSSQIKSQETKYRTPEDVLDPAFWANISNQLGPFHRIECRCEDGTWLSELLVLEAGRSYARVKELTRYLLTTADVAQSQDAPLTGFKVLWRGVHHRWAVKRLVDNEVIHNGEPTAAAATDWLREHMKALV